MTTVYRFFYVCKLLHNLNSVNVRGIIGVEEQRNSELCIIEQASEIVRYHSPGVLSKVDLIDIN